MANWPRYRFEGNLKPPKERPPGAHEVPEPYLPPSQDLIDAVNLAIFLERPLLLEGEAGSGKSRLAYAVAYELGLPLQVWPVRSTSRAEEGLYRFDTIKRLYDAHIAKELAHDGRVDPKHDPTILDNYRELEALGKAFAEPDHPSVVLIDEVDKADLDFPNDLLVVLEEGWFPIQETGETIRATHKPIIIITSNREKGNLPLPFLRRCVYYFLPFPDTMEKLLPIVRCHFPSNEARALDPKLTRAAITRFLDIRMGRLHKQPGTSELLDWVTALHFFKERPYPTSELTSDKPLPYPELLFKLQADLVSRPVAA